MIDEIQTAIHQYQSAWQTFLGGLTDGAWLADCPMVAIGWKADDLTDFDAAFMTLRDMSDQVHMGWVNQRWLATFHLRQSRLSPDIRVIKLMQRRPGSTDEIGLDNIDFLLPQDIDAQALLTAEGPDVHWSAESNGEHARWLSVWFDGNEAKLRTTTVLDVCISELQDAKRDMTGAA
jgi:hypothetical protein